MWRVIFGHRGYVDKKVLDSLLPVGYVVKRLDDYRFLVCNEKNGREVGDCLILLPEGDILFRFYEGESEGLRFAIGFGQRYPDLNPVSVLFGFVFEEDGVYQLDQTPFISYKQVLARARTYVAAGKVYFVLFQRGNWMPSSVFVDAMWPILITTGLGDDLGPKRLTLKKNDKNMER